MLAVATGSLPAKLTPEGAVFALEQAALPVLKVMQAGGEPVIADLNAFGATKSKLSSLRSKLEGQGVELADGLSELLAKIESFSGLNNRSSTKGAALRDEISTAWANVRAGYLSLRGETPPPSTAEEPTESGAEEAGDAG
jgi:hypothetical protein